MCLCIRKATCCALAHKPYSQHVTKASRTFYGCHPFNPINNHVVNSVKIIVFYLNIIIRYDVHKMNTLCTSKTQSYQFFREIGKDKGSPLITIILL